MPKNIVYSLCVVAGALALHAQTYPSSFSDLVADRASLAATLPSEFTVEPASGALIGRIPLGPGIGEGALRFVPTIHGRQAPQISWTRTSLGAGHMAASSQATFSLSPGCLDLKLTSVQDVNFCTYISSFELWNGISGTFNLQQGHPYHESRVKPETLLAAYGYVGAVGSVPFLPEAGENPRPLVKYATDGSLLIGFEDASAPAIRTPAAWGPRPPYRRGQVRSPSRILLIKQGIAYEFSAMYDSRFAERIGTIRSSRFRLTAIRNLFAERIQITYKGTYPAARANPNLMGYVAEYFRNDQPTGQKITLVISRSCPQPEISSLRIEYCAPGTAPLAFEIDFMASFWDGVPEGVDFPVKQEVPEWCELSTRLVIHRISNTASQEWLSFGYDAPRFEHLGCVIKQRLLRTVTWSSGRVLDLEWKCLPYRKNDARPGEWQGYFSENHQLFNAREVDKRNWFYGIVASSDKDRVTPAERRTVYERTVPVPRAGSRNGWDQMAFHTAIGHPDGQVTLEKYVRPLQDQDGGPGATAEEQVQTLAHLRHMKEEVRLYAAGADWRSDLERPADASSAHRVTTFSYGPQCLGQDGFPPRRLERGAYPRVAASATLDRDTGVLETVKENTWDDAACAMRRRQRTLHQGQICLYAEQEETVYQPLLHLGILDRAAGGSHTVTVDASAGAAGVPLPRTRGTALAFDAGATEPLNRLLSHSRSGWDGTSLETRYGYLADAGPEARLLASAGLVSPNLAGEAGVASYGHDGLGRLTAISPKGVAWHWSQTLDGLGRTLERRDENQLATQYRWDPAGRLLRINPPGRQDTQVSYDPDGRGKTIACGGRETTVRFNAFGDLIRETRTAQRGWSHRKWGYDLGGRPTWETGWRPGSGSDAGWQGQEPGPCSRQEYDGRARVVRRVSPDGDSTSITHAAGSRTEVTAGGRTLQQFDPLGRLFRVTDPLGQVTSYGYDPEGRLASARQTDPASGATQARAWSYNGLGWLQSETQPECGSTTFSKFTVLGKPQLVTLAGDGSGPARVLRLEYDGLGRILRRRSEDGSVAQVFGYDAQAAGGRAAAEFGCANGQPTYARDGEVEVFRAYREAGGALSGLTTRVWAGGTLVQEHAQAFQYDPYGGRVRAETDGRGLSTRFDPALGLPIQVGGPQGALATAGPLDAAGNLQSLAYGNGVTATFSYGEDQLRPRALGYAKGSNRILGWAYGYDQRGLLTSTGEDAYQYDGLGRLTQATLRPDPAGQPVTQLFSYDAFGNPTASSATGALPAAAAPFNNQNNFTFNATERATLASRNRLPATSSDAPTGALYDPQGHLTQIWGRAGDPASLKTFTVDALGRITALSDSQRNLTEQYAYNAEGLRTSVLESRSGVPGKRRLHFYNDARQLVSQYEQTLVAGTAALGPPAWKRDLVYLGARPVAELDAQGVHFTLTDHLGTPRAVLDSQGNLEASSACLPFGETVAQQGSVTSASGYTQHEQTDPSGLIYMQGRFYAPQYHRFLSPDPGRDQQPEDPQSWNLFSYVRNNPVTKFDPDGQEQVDITFRAFIPHYTMLGFHGDNRGFSAAQNVSSRVSVGFRIETDPVKNGGNPLIGTPLVNIQSTRMTVAGWGRTATGPQLPEVTATQDKAGMVSVNIREHVKNPFQFSIGLGIRSDLNVTLNQSATHAVVSGTLSGAPSFEMNFTPFGDITTNLPLQVAPLEPRPFFFGLQSTVDVGKAIDIKRINK